MMFFGSAAVTGIGIGAAICLLIGVPAERVLGVCLAVSLITAAAVAIVETIYEIRERKR